MNSAHQGIQGRGRGGDRYENRYKCLKDAINK